MFNNATPPSPEQTTEIYKRITDMMVGVIRMSETQEVVALAVSSQGDYDSDCDYYLDALYFAEEIRLKNKHEACMANLRG